MILHSKCNKFFSSDATAFTPQMGQTLKEVGFINLLGTGELSLIFLLISNLISRLRLHQFLGTKTTEANKSLKTDANRTH